MDDWFRGLPKALQQRAFLAAFDAMSGRGLPDLILVVIRSWRELNSPQFHSTYHGCAGLVLGGRPILGGCRQ